MRRLEVEFKERQVASYGYTTSLNAYLDYLEDGLFTILECRREHYGSVLDGICGDSFRVFYSRAKRMEGTFCYPFNPLRACAQALGYEYEYTYGQDEEAAIGKLKQYIGSGRPVISPFVLPPPEWALVIGYDQNRFYLHTYAGVRTYPEEKFREGFSSWWQPTLESEHPTAAHPMFVLGKRGMRKDLSMIIIEALKRGIELMTMETFSWDGEEYYGGFRALEERARDLEEGRNWDELEEDSLFNWSFYPLLYYQLSRWARTGFLSISSRQFRGIDAERMKTALVHTEEGNRLVKEYRDTLSVPWPKSPPNAGEIVKGKLKDRDRREKGISLLRKIADYERKTVDQIEQMVT